MKPHGVSSPWTTASLWREKEFVQLPGIPFERYTQAGREYCNV